MKLSIPALLILLFFHLPFLKAGEYNFRHYTNKDGLSHHTIHSSLQDRRGYMWFGTEEGLNRFDGYTFDVYKNSPQDSTGLPSNTIYALFEDSRSRIWISTSGGLCYYDPGTDSFYRNFPPFENEEKIFFSFVREDKEGDLWFIRPDLITVYSSEKNEIKQYRSEEHFRFDRVTMTKEGYPLFADGKNVYFYQSQDDTFSRVNIIPDEEEIYISTICEIPDIGILIGTDREGARIYRFHNKETEEMLPGVQVRTICRYNRNTYWLGTESGIYIYDAINRTIEHLTKSLTNEYTISDNAIYSISRDKEGGIWVGSFFGGINYLPSQYIHFSRYIGGKTHSGLLGNAIREICPDQYGHLWLGTEDNGINKYDPITGTFTNYSYNNPENPLSATNIHGLFADGDKLWVGSFNKGIDVLDIPSGKIIRKYNQANTGRQLGSNFILCFYRTSDGKFLVGTGWGIVEFNPETEQFSRWQSVYELVRQIYEDRQKNIWIVTANGLFRYDITKDHMERYMHEEGNLATLPANSITSVFEDSKGDIWVTTMHGLARYEPSSDLFSQIYPPEPFPSNILFRILEDEKEIFWISSANGLISFHPEKYETKRYSYTEGLHEAQFNFSSSYKSSDGTLYFGTTNGMISFAPHEFKTDYFVPPIYISSPGLNSTEKMNDTNLRLPHNHPPLTLSYSALSFTAPDAIQYAYKLEGIDKEWNFVNRNREVTFANLSPGKYFFKVKSTNSSGTWQENEETLPIIVVPPFWATGWAMVLYSCLLLLLIYLIYEYKKKNLEKKHLQNQILFENKKEKELYDAKIQFFTYITHEIRTPLTLIKAPLERVISSHEGSPQTHEYLQIIEKNTRRLLDLSTQLLDFRRTETRGFQLTFVKTDILLWTETILTRFRTTLEGENRNFAFHVPNYPVEAQIDREAFAKIISNLLTNAFKYSEKEISLKICFPENSQSVFNIILINDGTLIPIQEKENIFEPFYRVKNNETKPGSGIGLSLVHSLVELHKGNIFYNHTPDGKNRFQITLPVEQINSLKLENKHAELSLPDRKKTGRKEGEPFILVVEDQPDMRHFIAHELAEHFRIITAENGKKALEILQQESIDGIISDIMMPEMDGYELCNEVKNNIHSSHIPVILLTAQHNLKSRLEGLNQGADAYIEKPFSVELLISQIKNLLKNRDLLKSSYIEKPHVESSSLALSKVDALFLEKLNSFIEENIANEHLNVDMIAEEMGMSTSSLYRKVKGVSGVSPVEFIRITRLKKAIYWMKEGEYRINEIAFMSGFSSPAYFSTCFQKQYGKSPSEFLKDIS